MQGALQLLRVPRSHELQRLRKCVRLHHAPDVCGGHPVLVLGLAPERLDALVREGVEAAEEAHEAARAQHRPEEVQEGLLQGGGHRGLVVLHELLALHDEARHLPLAAGRLDRPVGRGEEEVAAGEVADEGALLRRAAAEVALRLKGVGPALRVTHHAPGPSADLANRLLDLRRVVLMALGDASVRTNEDHTSPGRIAPVDLLQLQPLGAMRHHAHDADHREVVALGRIVGNQQPHERVGADPFAVLLEKVCDVDDAVDEPLLVGPAAQAPLVLFESPLARARLYSQPIPRGVDVLLHGADEALDHEGLVVPLPEGAEPLARQGGGRLLPQHQAAGRKGRPVGGDRRRDRGSRPRWAGLCGCRRGGEAQAPPARGKRREEATAERVCEAELLQRRPRAVVGLTDRGDGALRGQLDARRPQPLVQSRARAAEHFLRGQRHLHVALHGKIGLGLLEDHRGGVEHLLVVGLPAPAPTCDVVRAAWDCDTQLRLEERRDVNARLEGILPDINEAEEHLRKVPLRAVVRELVEHAPQEVWRLRERKLQQHAEILLDNVALRNVCKRDPQERRHIFRSE
mmetsp:Transcript_41661/g.124445  ORF Transcript_41661/g.124445 Transcript_41661/m.124445 type:complete len:573 (+) Transcript_41661:986-2704(+)